MNHSHIDTVINKIRQKWGHQAIQSANYISQERDVLPTGFTDLDTLIQGIPIKNLTQLKGKPTSGMTSLTYYLMSNAQNLGQHVVYVDMGTTFDGGYATKCGVDVNEVILVETQEEYLILDLIVEILNSQLVELLILNLLSMRAMKLDWRKILPTIWASSSAVVMLTQPHIISDITGLRLHVKRQKWLMHSNDIIGCTSNISIERHRYGNEGKSVVLQIPFEGKEA